MWHFYAPDISYRYRISRGWTYGDLSHGQAGCGLFNSLIITNRTRSLALAKAGNLSIEVLQYIRSSRTSTIQGDRIVVIPTNQGSVGIILLDRVLLRRGAVGPPLVTVTCSLVTTETTETVIARQGSWTGINCCSTTSGFEDNIIHSPRSFVALASSEVLCRAPFLCQLHAMCHPPTAYQNYQQRIAVEAQRPLHPLQYIP